MEWMIKLFQRLQDDDSGQATVEYVLMLGMAVSVISIFTVSVRKTTFKLWATFTREIAAACPVCPTDSRYIVR